MAQTPISRNAKGRYTVPGKKNIDVDLGSNDPAQFAVVQKDIDPAIPTTFQGITIEWFNAFGIRRRNKDLTLGDYAGSIAYTIVMDALPPGKRLFAYYGGQVHELGFTTVGALTTAPLPVGDPPVGWGP